MRNVDPDSPLYKAAYNDDFPWIRDAAGNRVLGDDEGTEFLIDFTHPDAQDIIVQQALAVKECGLYDGIYIGWWHEDGLVLNRYRTFEEEQQARSVILERICDVVNDDFLIIVGSGQHKPTERTGTAHSTTGGHNRVRERGHSPITACRIDQLTGVSC